MSLFYEDFAIRNKFESQDKTISEEAVRNFAELTGDKNRLHLDSEYAKSTIFGRPIVHGMLLASIALGLWYEMNITRESIIAFLGINNLSFKLPVYYGEKIRLVSKVISSRDSKSNPDAGIVVFEDQLLNKAGNVVVSFERALLLRKR